MKKDKKITEVSVTITEPEKDYEGDLYGEIFYTALSKVVDAFTTLTGSTLPIEDATRIIGCIEGLEVAHQEKYALEMLRTLFCVTGHHCAVCGINYILATAEEDPQIMEIFIEEFFDDEAIDWFLVENWLTEGGTNE